MPSHSARRQSAKRLLALLAAACGACSSFAGTPQPPYVRCLDLPPDVAAAVAAGAVRLALAFADPVPAAAGAPADQLSDGRYAITYELDERGNWTPTATHRLTVVCSAGPSPRIDVRAEALSGSLALPPRHATERLSVDVLPAPCGTIVHAKLPDQVGARVAQFLDRAFAVALDPSAVQLGLDEPNLEALACHWLRTRAGDLLEHGQPRLAAQHLLRATRLRGATSDVHRQLGELAARSGDDSAARDQFTQALLVATDPTARAQLASLLAGQQRGAADRARLHRQADERAAADDFDGAETLLHTARRRTPLPAEDYLLTSQLHLRRHDPLAALGCALLAREHEGAAAAAVGAAVAAHRSTTPEDVADRFLREARPFAAPTPAAAPPR